mmetsp:Transcript_12651/g.25746  ORF Transcript_12651/g.25746 Transcript_12651/m.25746 type:complete len:98 (+) Transcript_12651:419-712(+)
MASSQAARPVRKSRLEAARSESRPLVLGRPESQHTNREEDAHNGEAMPTNSRKRTSIFRLPRRQKAGSRQGAFAMSLLLACDAGGHDKLETKNPEMA